MHVGPSDYVPWLEDRKWCHIRIEGTTFGDVPLNMELKLEVWDSPNSAGVVIDAIRCLKLALDNGLSGALEGPSSYFMKSPPVQYTDDEAHDAVEEFITRYAGKRDKVEPHMAELAETVTQPAQHPAPPTARPLSPSEVGAVCKRTRRGNRLLQLGLQVLRMPGTLTWHTTRIYELRSEAWATKFGWSSSMTCSAAQAGLRISCPRGQLLLSQRWWAIRLLYLEDGTRPTPSATCAACSGRTRPGRR